MPPRRFTVENRHVSYTPILIISIVIIILAVLFPLYHTGGQNYGTFDLQSDYKLGYAFTSFFKGQMTDRLFVSFQLLPFLMACLLVLGSTARMKGLCIASSAAGSVILLVSIIAYIRYVGAASGYIFGNSSSVTIIAWIVLCLFFAAMALSFMTVSVDKDYYFLIIVAVFTLGAVLILPLFQNDGGTLYLKFNGGFNQAMRALFKMDKTALRNYQTVRFTLAAFFPALLLFIGAAARKKWLGITASVLGIVGIVYCLFAYGTVIKSIGGKVGSAIFGSSAGVSAGTWLVLALFVLALFTSVLIGHERSAD